MVKQNPMINIGSEKSLYLSPPHFLMFVPFPRISDNLNVIFPLTLHTRKYKNLQESDCSVSLWNLKPLFLTCSHLLSLVVSFVFTCCHSLFCVATRCTFCNFLIPHLLFYIRSFYCEYTRKICLFHNGFNYRISDVTCNRITLVILGNI